MRSKDFGQLSGLKWFEYSEKFKTRNKFYPDTKNPCDDVKTSNQSMIAVFFLSFESYICKFHSWNRQNVLNKISIWNLLKENRIRFDVYIQAIHRL